MPLKPHAPMLFNDLDQDLLDKGRKAFLKEDLALAIDFLSGVADLKQTPWASQMLAEACFRRAARREGQNDEARDLKESLRLSPKEGRYWYHYGLIMHRDASLDQALEAYEKAEAFGFERKAALAFVHGLACLKKYGSAGLKPISGGETEHTALFSIMVSLLRQDWESLLIATPLSHKGKGMPGPGFNLLLKGMAHSGLEQWDQAAQVLGSIASDAYPAPMEALRVFYYSKALDALGRSAEAKKLRAATFARTKSPLLAAMFSSATLEKLEQHLKQGQWQDVIRESMEIVKYQPSHPRALGAMSQALDALGQQAASQGDWKTASGHWARLSEMLEKEKADRCALAYQNLAIAQEKQEMWLEASRAWEGCLEAMPKRITKALAKTDSFFACMDQEALNARRSWVEQRALEMGNRSGNFSHMLKQQKAMLKRNPQDFGLRLSHAKSLLESGQDNAAAKAFEALLRLDPQNFEAMEGLAEAQLSIGKFGEAEKGLRRLLEMQPERASAKQGLANAIYSKATRMALIHFDASLTKLMEEAAELAPKDLKIRSMLMAMNMQSGNEKEGRRQMAIIEEMGPQGFLAMLNVWTRHHDMEEVKALLDRCQSRKLFDQAFCVEAILDCLDVVDDLVEEEETSRPGRKKGKTSVKESDRWMSLVMELSQKVISLPDNPAALTRLVDGAMEGHPRIALYAAERLARLFPDDPQRWLTLAMVESGSNQIKAVVLESLEKAKRLSRSKDPEMHALTTTFIEMVKKEGAYMLYYTMTRAMEGLEDGSLDDFFDDEEILF